MIRRISGSDAERQPSLATLFYGFLFVASLVIIGSAAVFGRERVRANQHAAMDLAVGVRLQGAEVDLARRMQADWRAVAGLAAAAGAPGAPKETLTGLVRGDGAQFLWVGLATPNGRLIGQGSDGLIDTNVSDRSWFGPALRQGFATLVPAIPSSVAPNRRSLVFATPVRDATGRVIGVAAGGVALSTLVTHLRESATALDLDLFLVAGEAGVVAGTIEEALPDDGLLSTRAAAIGIAATQIETWPDGHEYFTAVVPHAERGDAPRLGWELIARIDPDEFRRLNRGILADSVFYIMGAIMIVGGLSWLFVRIYLKPIDELALSAARMADGIEDYPYEGQQSREIATLSAALVRLAGDRDRDPPQPSAHARQV